MLCDACRKLRDIQSKQSPCQLSSCDKSTKLENQHQLTVEAVRTDENRDLLQTPSSDTERDLLVEEASYRSHLLYGKPAAEKLSAGFQQYRHQLELSTAGQKKWSSLQQCIVEEHQGSLAHTEYQLTRG
jgi:hypothetical protein